MTQDELKRLFTGDPRMDRKKEVIERTIAARAIDIDVTRKETHEVVVKVKGKKSGESEFIAEPFVKYELPTDATDVVIDTVHKGTKQACYREFYKVIK